MKKKIEVILDNGEHVCDPTRTEVSPGDTVEWSDNVIVFFPKESPFEEGRGPFHPRDAQTVRQVSASDPNNPFTFETIVNGQRKPTRGDIIVR